MRSNSLQRQKMERIAQPEQIRALKRYGEALLATCQGYGRSRQSIAPPQPVRSVTTGSDPDL
jgi:hypothetical protein